MVLPLVRHLPIIQWLQLYSSSEYMEFPNIFIVITLSIIYSCIVSNRVFDYTRCLRKKTTFEKFYSEK